jgi:hypothetical protein
MASEEINALGVFKRKTVRKISGPIKEEESWRLRTNKEVQDILQGADIVKFKKLPTLRSYGYIEMTNKERMPKQIVTARMAEIRKRGRQWKRWTDEIAQDLKIMVIRNWYTVARYQKERRRTVLKAKVHNRL